MGFGIESSFDRVALEADLSLAPVVVTFNLQAKSEWPHSLNCFPSSLCFSFTIEHTHI